jgi:hypothetical protein
MIDNPGIAVAGHLVSDEIIFADGKRVSAPGGISYNLAALLSVMKNGKVIPICEIGSDIEGMFNEYFGKHDFVDTLAVRQTTLPNVVNRLVYDKKGDREEWNSRIPERLSLGAIEKEADAVLLNFISGDDLSIDELTEFRSRFEGIILCDYHSLALGRDSDGKRFYRKHHEWDRYISQANIVQMNVAELATIGGSEGMSFGNIIAICGLIHAHGAEICIITMGPNGAVLSVDRGKAVYHVPPIRIDDEVDPTGCGDTFASVFLYNYLLSDDALHSVEIANCYAAAKVTFAGLDGFGKIGMIMEQMGPAAKPVKLK